MTELQGWEHGYEEARRDDDIPSEYLVNNHHHHHHSQQQYQQHPQSADAMTQRYDDVVVASGNDEDDDDDDELDIGKYSERFRKLKEHAYALTMNGHGGPPMTSTTTSTTYHDPSLPPRCVSIRAFTLLTHSVVPTRCTPSMCTNQLALPKYLT